MPIAIAGLVILAGLTIALASWILLPTTVTRGDRLLLRKHRLLRVDTGPTAGSDEPQSHWLASLGGRLRALIPANPLRRLETRLVQAGYVRGQALDIAVVSQLTLMVIGIAVGLAFDPVWAVAGGLAGWLAIDFPLARAVQRRQQQITLALPDGLDMLAVSVEAGLALEAALQRYCANEAPPSRALCQEFRQFLRDIQLGRTRQDAFTDLGQRSGVHDLHLLTSALKQADRWGVEMANIMRVQADHLRTRRLLRAEEQAMKAPIKILMPLVFCIFPAIFVVLLGPAALQINTLFP
jgi:tight adherence protein C